MSTGSLTSRERAQSHGAIRKRLLRSNSESKYRQLGKNSTMSSFRPKLERLLQQGKVQQIVNTDPHTKANLFYTTHINELEKQLAAAKKSLSTMVMKSKGKQYNINKLKNQIAKIQKECMALQSESSLNKNKLNQNKDQLQKKKENLEDKMWVEKCYRHIFVRCEKDEDFLRARHDRKHENVSQLKKEKALLETTFYNLCQTHKKLEHAVGVAKKISKEQTQQKNQFIELLNQQMAQKDLLDDIKLNKNQKDKQINDLAPSVIEKEELQKYLNILFTHKIVSQIIKTKSKKLMDQYSGVQRAYMHIKSNTNIVQLDKMLERMEKQDEQYEKILKKVTILENQLRSVDKQMENAVKEEYNILSKDAGQVVQGIPQGYFHGIEKDNYQINLCEKQKLMDRKNDDDILKKKIELWVSEHAKMYDVDTKINSEADFFTQLTLLAANIKKKSKK